MTLSSGSIGIVTWRDCVKGITQSKPFTTSSAPLGNLSRESKSSRFESAGNLVGEGGDEDNGGTARHLAIRLEMVSDTDRKLLFILPGRPVGSVLGFCGVRVGMKRERGM